MSHDKCGCTQGKHIWDTDYDQPASSERWCVCCEHFFLAEDGEDAAADNAIEWKNDSIINKPKNSQPSNNNIAMNKGVIRRRT